MSESDLEKMEREYATAIAEAEVPTEKELRDAKVPRPKSVEELTDYINTLTDRPHDYGTCVYAMSMCAVAAYYYVSHVLSVTGFQASCADMDILRRTRGWKFGRIVDYSNLLYPQYCDRDHFLTWEQIIEEHKQRFADMAREQLGDSAGAHDEVRKHWEWLASLAPPKAAPDE